MNGKFSIAADSFFIGWVTWTRWGYIKKKNPKKPQILLSFSCTRTQDYLPLCKIPKLSLWWYCHSWSITSAVCHPQTACGAPLDQTITQGNHRAWHLWPVMWSGPISHHSLSFSAVGETTQPTNCRPGGRERLRHYIMKEIKRARMREIRLCASILPALSLSFLFGSFTTVSCFLPVELKAHSDSSSLRS